MSNKKTILIITLVLTLLVSLSIYSYLYQHTPKATLEKSIQADPDVINKYLTDNFIEKISNDGAGNKDYLDQAVSDYQVKKSIERVEVSEESQPQFKATVIVKTTTTNTQTGFVVTTRDTYAAALVKTDGQWKIDNYELTGSETVR
jgi:uncharacterized protein YktB (UPF0637 family)